MIEIVKHRDSTLSCECPEWKKYEKRRKERWGV